MKLEYKLGRIHCAGCASSLEELISKVNGVEHVSLNFISNNLVIEISKQNHSEIEENIKNTIHKFDKNIEILDPKAEQKQERKEKIKNIIHYSSLGVSFLLLCLLSFLSINKYIELGVYIFCYLLIGYKVLFTAGRNIITGKFLDENFLMGIATIGAFIIGQYSEALAVMLFYNVGDIFQNLAVKKSEREIKKIASIKETHANLVLDNTEMEVTLDKVGVGDIIRVKVGERVPLDGKIIEGQTYVNLSALTGESAEKFMFTGDTILSGTIVTSSVILVEVAKTESESTVSKIIELVENSSNNKSKTEKFISRFAKFYTPIVVFLAIFVAFVIPIFSLYRDFTIWVYRALMFLVVSCPCALVISVPLGFFAGIGAAARNGILIKGANYLEALEKATSFVFDKTGTLTYGNFKISKIVAAEDKTQEEVLEFIAYAENFSNHRIAKSIVEEYKYKTKKEINFAWINGVNEIAGEGIVANIFGIDCLVGNLKLLADNDVVIDNIDNNNPNTIIYLAQNGVYAGHIEIQDEIRGEATTSISALRELGIENVLMFTGDNKHTASVVAQKIGASSYEYNLLPADKVEKLKTYKENGQKLAFVGDGINDAPILSSVDVGIAMGGVGSDIAIESADVVIVDDNLSKIPLAVSIARKTKKIINENIIIALGIKVVVLVLSVIGLSSMWLAIFADVGVSLLAILNSIRALFVSKKFKKKLDNKKQKWYNHLYKIKK